MEMTNTTLSKRHSYILEKLKKCHSIKVDDLCKELSVSPITIRRDLQLLENKGFVERFHGGAKILDNNNDSFNKNNCHSILKHKLAEMASTLIEDNDTIFINSSSTAILILSYIKNKRVTVITNNGDALNIPRDPDVQLILTGGEVCPSKNSMVGDFAANLLAQVTADKCFLGVSSISGDYGIGTSIFQETSINKMMLSRCSGDRVIIADSSKVGKDYNFLSADISMISCLVTDSDCSPLQENLLIKKGIDILKVNL